jgi:hypothetical protein
MRIFAKTAAKTAVALGFAGAVAGTLAFSAAPASAQGFYFNAPASISASARRITGITTGPTARAITTTAAAAIVTMAAAVHKA